MENNADFNDRAKVYAEAIDIFGVDMQLIVAIEELSELQKEICKAIRYENRDFDKEHVAEEIADVLIMAEQLQRIFGIGDLVKRYQNKKIVRLVQRLEGREHRMCLNCGMTDIDTKKFAACPACGADMRGGVDI